MPQNVESALRVEFLSCKGCPGVELALLRLREVLAEAALDIPIECIEVADELAIEEQRFPGSPTIRVNGLDIEERRRGEPSRFACRLYPNGEPAPPVEMIRASLRRALGPKTSILFLCTGNSCRSQMAEGWARALKGDVIEAYSAGIEVHGLNPRAVRVMAEAGIDISDHRSKRVDDLMDVPLDYVITVCGHARETCPVFPGKAQLVHAPFDDPPRLAAQARTDEEALAHYRRVRDEIRVFVGTLPGIVTESDATKISQD